MATYFIFSDEAGAYQSNPSDSFCRRRPLYIRSAVIMDVESWAILKEEFFELKKKNELPTEKEIKWSYLWSLTKHQNNNEPITENKPYYFLKDYQLSKFRDFITESCRLLSGCSYCRIILTVTSNSVTNTMSKLSIYKWHLQEIMQRIEMEIQQEQNNLAIVFFDATDKNVDKFLREAYSKIYFDGDFIEKYSHIKDSISLELSHHSFGIQIADYTSGCFNGFLRDFEFSTNLFKECIYRLLRRDHSGEVLGFGIREVPRNTEFRSQIDKKLIKILPNVDI